MADGSAKTDPEECNIRAEREGTTAITGRV